LVVVEPGIALKLIEDLLINQLTEPSPLEFGRYAKMLLDGDHEYLPSPYGGGGGFGGGGNTKSENEQVEGADVVARRLLDVICLRILDEHENKPDTKFAAKAAKIVDRIRSLDGYKNAQKRELFDSLRIEQDLRTIKKFASGDSGDTGRGGGPGFSSFVKAIAEQRKQQQGGGGLGGGVF